MCDVCFSDSEIATASISEVIHDRQLPVDTGGDSCKLQQCNDDSHPGPDMRLTVVNVDTKNDAEMVECQLETAKHTPVSLKFTDQPIDVAASMVSQTPHLSPLITTDLLYTHDHFKQPFSRHIQLVKGLQGNL